MKEKGLSRSFLVLSQGQLRKKGKSKKPSVLCYEETEQQFWKKNNFHLYPKYHQKTFVVTAHI